MLRPSLTLLLVLLCGCRTTTPAAPPPASLWEAPLSFTADGLPVVQVTVSGKPTLLLVDTAAEQTALEAWFVKTLEPGDERALKLGALSTTAKWKVVDTVKGHAELGIGGTWSPQRALSTGALVVDFPRGRLVALGGRDNAWLRWLDERSPKGQLEGLSRSAPLEGGLHIKTRIGDGLEVVTLVATANLRTAYARKLFDASLVNRDQVAGLFVKIRETEFGPLDVALLPAEAPVAGRLGLDVLRPLVLLLPVQPGAPIWFMTPRE